MKTFILLICLLVPQHALAWGIAMMGGEGVSSSGSSSVACSEYFNTADTVDVDGNTNFDSEYPNDSTLLSIVSNELVFNATTSGSNAYASETSCIADSDTEYTVKFTVEFSVITGIDNATSYATFIELRDDAGTEQQALFRFSASGGNLYSYTSTLYYDLGTATGNTVVMTGVTAATKYTCYVYFNLSATVGEAAMKCGSWAESTTDGNEDNDIKNGAGTLRLGAIDHYWGDGTADTNIIYDDFEIYKTDEMP